MTSQNEHALPVAIYARISRDAHGEGLGIERQEADCQALAAKLGWKVVEVFVDNDISAYSGKARPQYRALLEAVRAGRIRGVVAWHTDRLHRRASELEEFVAVAEAHHLQIQTVTAGNVDLSSASGRMIARMLGAAAQHEIDHARERMRSAKAQMAVDGKYRGGPRPFGYESDGVTIRDAEAEVIRWASTGLVAGRSLASLARKLNEQGYTTSAGKSWTYARLRDVMTRPRNAGLLHKGRADRGDLEIIGQAQWEAIIDEDSWRAVYAILTDPSRRIQKGNEVRWLGSGIYLCGKCGGPLRPAPYGGTPSRGKERKYLYRCTASAHLTVSTSQTDEHVLQVVSDLIRDTRVIAAMSTDEGAAEADRTRREALLARLESFENDYALGDITGTQLAKATASVTTELEQIEARLTESVQKSVSSQVVGAIDPGAAFLEAPIDVQRAVTASVVKVVVQPAPYRGATWTADRLRITSAAANDADGTMANAR